MKRFEPSARLDGQNVVEQDGKVVARLQPTDFVEVQASHADAFGSMRVGRKDNARLLWGTGVLVGGIITSAAFFPVCESSDAFEVGCIGATVAGLAVSTAVGLTLIALGLRQSLFVSTPMRTASLTVVPATGGATGALFFRF